MVFTSAEKHGLSAVWEKIPSDAEIRAELKTLAAIRFPCLHIPLALAILPLAVPIGYFLPQESHHGA
jgi:hypothetical protein